MIANQQHDAYVQITIQFILEKPDAVISLVTPEEFSVDALNLMYRSRISDGDCESIAQKIMHLVKEGTD